MSKYNYGYDEMLDYQFIIQLHEVFA